MSKGLSVLTILFCSPLYFILRKKWLAALVNSTMYLLAVATMILGVGVLFWMVAFAHGYWDFAMLMREDTMRRQAQLIAEETAKKA